MPVIRHSGRCLRKVTFAGDMCFIHVVAPSESATAPNSLKSNRFPRGEIRSSVTRRFVTAGLCSCYLSFTHKNKKGSGMPRVGFLRLLALLACCVATGTSALADGPAAEQIRGFQVEFDRATNRQRESVLPSLIRQIEIVESVGLPEPVMAFFRTVPIVIDPDLTGMNGAYKPLAGRDVVRIKPTSLPESRAILLHELLHAYQHQVLKIPTPPVGRAYQQALRPETYPSDYRGTYFLSNGREFFAVTGEVYLFGTTERPPYSCSNLKKAQPQWIEYLAGLFGPRDCP
jgi:hypothetical protein